MKAGVRIGRIWFGSLFARLFLFLPLLRLDGIGKCGGAGMRDGWEWDLCPRIRIR